MNIKNNIFETKEFGHLTDFTDFVFNDVRGLKLPLNPSDQSNAYCFTTRSYNNFPYNTEVLTGETPLKVTKFSNVNLGDVFIYCGHPCLKVKSFGEENSFCLKCSVFEWVAPDDEVILTNATLTLNSPS